MLTYYKNLEMHLLIHLLLPNRSKSFPEASVVEIGLSDVHKMTVTVVKTTFEKLKLRVIYIRNWEEFCNEKFRTQLSFKLSL